MVMIMVAETLRNVIASLVKVPSSRDHHSILHPFTISYLTCRNDKAIAPFSMQLQRRCQIQTNAFLFKLNRLVVAETLRKIVNRSLKTSGALNAGAWGLAKHGRAGFWGLASRLMKDYLAEKRAAR